MSVCISVQPPSVCLVSSDILENVLLQDVQEYFLTSECVWRWALRLDLSAKALLQYVHENGFSPVWVRIWPCSNQGLEKAFPQIVHLHGSVWVLICIFKAPRETYTFSQYLQLKDFLGPSPAAQWNCLCLERPENVE